MRSTSGEPVAGMWSVRPRGEGVAVEVGSGDHIIDFAFPEPSPPPVTTDHRLADGYLLVCSAPAGSLTYFGGAPVSYDVYYPFTAADALDRIDAMYADWIAGVRSLDEDALAEPCREEGHEQDTMAALILHIHREVIHHELDTSSGSTPGGSLHLTQLSDAV